MTLTLPPLAAGTLTTHGRTFVRLTHLVDWLEDVERAVDETDADKAALVDELRRMLERVAETPPDGPDG